MDNEKKFPKSKLLRRHRIIRRDDFSQPINAPFIPSNGMSRRFTMRRDKKASIYVGSELRRKFAAETMEFLRMPPDEQILHLELMVQDDE